MPTATTADSTAPRFLTRIAAALAAWSGRGGANEADVDAFDALIALASEPTGASFDRGLVKLAYETAGRAEGCVELWRDRGWGPRKVAAWPELASPASASESEPTATARIDFPVRCGGRTAGALRVVTPEGAKPVAPGVRRRLASIAILAAAFDRGETQQTAPRPAGAVLHDAVTGLPGEPFLDTFLSYAAALATRRKEPLSLLYIAVDRLAAIHDVFGPALANEAIRKVGRMIASGLRSSDMVARLDDGRLVAVLPGAAGDDAAHVADSIRESVAAAGAATESMPLLTVSIGVSTSTTTSCETAADLRASASAALESARTQGRDLVVRAPLPTLDPKPRLRLAQ